MLRIVLILAFGVVAHAQTITVEKLDREIGVLTDTTTYIVRGSNVKEVERALRIVRIREAAEGTTKVAEHDFDTLNSVAVVMPYSIPTGIVVKRELKIYGGGWFGPVWGQFEIFEGDGFVIVKDIIAGSPIYRFGHNTFAQADLAILRAIERVRNNPKLCEPFLSGN